MNNYIDAIAADIFTRAHGGGTASDGPTGDRMLYRIYAVLALAKGESTTLKDVHDAWSAWMIDVHPDHRSLIPFDELRPDVQEMDRLYMDAIHAVARVLASALMPRVGVTESGRISIRHSATDDAPDVISDNVEDAA